MAALPVPRRWGLDGCEVHRHPRLAKVWQRGGEPLRVPAAGEDAKFAVFGALDDAGGRLVCRTAGRKDGGAFVAFLDRPAAAFPDGPPVAVLDNVGYHKGRLAKNRWMAHQDRVRPLWLPADAPGPNPIGRVWRHPKDTPSCRRRRADLDALEAATAPFLARLVARFHRPEPGGAPVQAFCRSA